MTDETDRALLRLAHHSAGLIAGSLEAQFMLVADMEAVRPGYRGDYVKRLRSRISQLESEATSTLKAGNIQYLKNLAKMLDKPSKRPPKLRLVDPDKDR